VEELKMKRHVALACVFTAMIATMVATSGQAGFSGTDLFLPMAGRQAGVHPSNWYTTVWVHNPGAAAATARIWFLERGTANPAPPWVDVLVGPGATEKLENVVEAYFHEQAFGALRVTCATEKLVVTSRVYSQASGEGESDSVGQDFAGVPASFAIGVGERSQILGAYQTLPTADSEHRYNFGVVETAGHSAWVRFRAVDAAGAELGRSELQVREWSQRQVAFKDHFPGVSTENARLEVEVISGEGKVIAYGSQIANGSQDPTTFEMSYKANLLGSTTVSHDATLTGDGSPGAPLALADAAVGKTKLSAAGGTAGQVLGTDGTALRWQEAGGASGLTAGGVAFGGAAGLLAQDAASLFWDDAGNRLGIGTAAPSQQLTLTGNLALPEATAAVGQIWRGGEPFLHSAGNAANLFLGMWAGNLSVTGPFNTGIGRSSLAALTTGSDNIATGFTALSSVTTGNYNAAFGNGALRDLVSGSRNAAFGYRALAAHQGDEAAAFGQEAMLYNTTGRGNSAFGAYAMGSNTTGDGNSAFGARALRSNVSGSSNTAIGPGALTDLTSGSSNVGLGANAGDDLQTGSSNVYVAAPAVAVNESQTIRIGAPGAHTRAFVAGIRGVTTAGSGAIPVVIDSAGQLGTVSSSARVKHDIHDVGEGASAALGLRPVTFRYDAAPDAVHFGLIAEEVAAVLPELVVRGADGAPETVAYHELPALLLALLQRQQATIARLEAELALVKASVAAAPAVD
jgi:hypothetical protein